jgi:hypothetical protein
MGRGGGRGRNEHFGHALARQCSRTTMAPAIAQTARNARQRIGWISSTDMVGLAVAEASGHRGWPRLPVSSALTEGALETLGGGRCNATDRVSDRKAQCLRDRAGRPPSRRTTKPRPGTKRFNV